MSSNVYAPSLSHHNHHLTEVISEIPDPNISPSATARNSTSFASKPPNQKFNQRTKQSLIKYGSILQNHFLKHVGAGLVASVAYFDPGNWSVDLQAGSQYGYKMLFVVLLSGLFAVILQSLATKLGCVTGKDLAAACRQAMHNHPKYPRLVRWGVLYPLYFLSECAIVATDLCELLGSSIALVLFIPSLPLYAAVLLTSFDVFIVLLFLDPSNNNGRPARLFEAFIVALVMTVFVSFIILIAKTNPLWVEVVKGFLPSKAIGQNADALYTSIGIVGATVMPHALFLGSSLATQNRDGTNLSLLSPTRSQDVDVDSLDYSEESHRRHLATQPPLRQRFGRYVASLFTAQRVNGDIEEDSLIDRFRFVKLHLKNAVVDIVLSLLGCATVINSAILIVAATVFYFGVAPDQRDSIPAANLFDTFNIIRDKIGKPAAYIFACALLTAGQSAAITATLSGQIVSGGFIAWKLSPFLTRTTTRMIALIPATITAAVVGKDGINALLVASQFTLSLVLPFVVLPLVYLTSSDKWMTIPIYDTVAPESQKSEMTDSKVDKGDIPLPGLEKGGSADPLSVPALLRTSNQPQVLGEPIGYKSYKNGKLLMIIGYVIFICILGADTIAIISLGEQ